MKLAPPRLPLQPLRGALGLRQLWFGRRASPVLPFSKNRRTETIAISHAAVAIVAFAWFIMFLITRSPHKSNPTDYGAVFVLVFWSIGEVINIVYGILFMRVRNLRLWNRPGQLAELFMCDLRPLEIGQLMFGRVAFQARLFITILYVGGAVGLAIFFPRSILLAIPLGLVALSFISSNYLMGWTQTALFLGTGNWLTHLMASIQFTFVYLFCIAPMYILTFISIAFCYDRFDHIPAVANLVWVVPLIAWTWVVQYLLARGWAARIEQAIFQRIEF